MPNPKRKAADKGMGIVAGATSSRQLLQMNNVSATYYDVFGFQCGDQAFDYVFHEPAPALLADAVEALVANVIFVGAFLVRQVTKSTMPFTIFVEPSPVPCPRNSIFPPS